VTGRLVVQLRHARDGGGFKTPRSPRAVAAVAVAANPPSGALI